MANLLSKSNLIKIIRDNEQKADEMWAASFDLNMKAIAHYSVSVDILSDKMIDFYVDNIHSYLDQKGQYKRYNEYFFINGEVIDPDKADEERIEFIAGKLFDNSSKIMHKNSKKLETKEIQKQLDELGKKVLETRILFRKKEESLRIMKMVSSTAEKLKLEKKKQVKHKSNKPIKLKSFNDFVNPSITDLEKLKADIKELFPFDKVIMSKMAICLLEESSILIIGDGQFKEFFNAFNKIMGRAKIGSRSRLNDSYKHSVEEQIRFSKDLNVVRLLMQPFITKFQPK